MNAVSNAAWIERLEALGLAVRQRVLAARSLGDELAVAVAQEGGDTIFAIDRMVEDTIERHVDSWPDACKPLLLIAEGLGVDGRRMIAPAGQNSEGGGGSGGAARYCLLVDPIDGTRNIMYDKRSAWFLAALTPGQGLGVRAPTLADSLVSVIVELPTSKAGWADMYATEQGKAATGRRVRIEDSTMDDAVDGVSDGAPARGPQDSSNAGHDIPLRPSSATTLRNGFAQVSNFFPGTKVLASELMERIAQATLGDIAPGSASIFDDQYLTTAGQMVELMLGHDRFCCDLRPLFYEVLTRRSGLAVRGLECHPYDCAGMLVAQQAGVVLTDGFGRSLDAPLSVHHGVHWCGYANQTLRRQIEPVIAAWLQERGVEPK